LTMAAMAKSVQQSPAGANTKDTKDTKRQTYL
jgi:hypothetical protein